MKTIWNWQKIGGWVLHGLIAAMMIAAGSAKLLGLFPAEEVAKLGLSVPIQVIGFGEVASAILLLIPRTASLGLYLTTAFWGGAICLHMSKAEPFVLQSAETEVSLAEGAPAPVAAGYPQVGSLSSGGSADSSGGTTEVTIELRQTLTGVFPRLGGMMVSRAAAATIEEALNGLERISA